MIKIEVALGRGPIVVVSLAARIRRRNRKGSIRVVARKILHRRGLVSIRRREDGGLQQHVVRGGFFAGGFKPHHEMGFLGPDDVELIIVGRAGPSNRSLNRGSIVGG